MTISSNISDPRQRTTPLVARVGSTFPLTRRAAAAALLFALGALPALAGGFYELDFIPPGPIYFAEDDSLVHFQVQVIGGCAPYVISWEVEIEHITTDASDIGVPIPTTLVFSDTNPVLAIDIPINDDTLIEDEEAFVVALNPLSVEMNCAIPPILPSEGSYKVEIKIDDDESFGSDHLVVEDAQADEGSGVIHFDVHRINANLAQSASATFQLIPISADAGVDYFVPPGNVINFPPGGPTTQSVAVNLADDGVAEGPENFALKLTSSTGTAIGDDLGIGTIVDDDTPSRLRIDDLTTEEGDEDRIVPVTVRLISSISLDDPVTVDYVVEPGTATPGEDFQLTSGTLTFEAEDQIQLIPLQVLGDTLPENDETLQIRLLNPDNAELFNAVATVTLLNDDESDGPIVSVSDAEVPEGDSGSTPVTLTIALDEPQDAPFAVAYTTEDGTAIAGLDYEAATGVVEFPTGETTATVRLNVLGDVEDEADEMFRLRLRDVIDGTPVVQTASRRFETRAATGRESPSVREPRAEKLIGDTEAVITIVDDDGPSGGEPPDVGVLDTQVIEGDEGTSIADFRVRLSEPVTFPVGVLFETFDGTATAADEDYTPRSGQVIFEPGDSEVLVPVPVAGDTRIEGDERFGLRLTAADGANIVRSEAVCLIRDDDEDDGGGGPGPGGGSVVRLLPTRPVTEGAGPAIIRLERRGSAAGPVQAFVVARGGTASLGEDLPEVQRVAEWRSGQVGTVEVQIPILDDSRQEDTEFFLVGISEARNARIGTPAQARQVIVDDDTPMNLVAISDLEQTVRVGTELTLEARVERDDGEPVPGAQVRWQNQRKAQIVGDEVTFSGDDGVVRQTVRFARTPGVARVGALLVGAQSGLDFRFRVEGDLGSTIGGGDEEDGDVADAFDTGCADEDEGDEFGEACDYLYGIESDAERRSALEGLAPRQALSHQRQALRAPRNQVRNVSARLTALRGGMARSAFNQLALSIQGQGLSLSPLQDAIAGNDPALDVEAHIADRVDLALRRAAGIVTEEGFQAMRAPQGGAASGDDGDFDYGGESPWGLFFNGRISLGDAPRLGERPDFEFQTEGLTLGVDRRVGSRWVLGAALGYNQSETEVGGDLGRLDLSGLSVSFYTTYYTENWYVDGVVTYGENEYDVERVIELPVPFRNVTRLTAVGSPDATQTAANLAFGYDFRLGEATVLSGFVRANWTRAEIDSYTEIGALLFDLQYESQTLDSLLGEIGVELTRPFSYEWGVLQPLVRIAMLHELDDDLDVVRARFARGRSPRTFRLEGSATDRDFFNVAVGATATLRRGWATYFQYDTDLERDDLDLYTFSGGFRFQF
ncbi:MAG: autotransporter domain-containing protein [Thermoanaerobaculia bacterium]|nr:autotransporter domain-containing protein [Thermoanaerobaculia bacterium]